MLQIKKGDSVIVLKGKDRGRRSKVMRVLPARRRAVVEGVNLVKKRQRPRQSGEKGQIIQVASPLHLSNIALYCEHCGRGVRFGTKLTGEKKIRVCRRCGREL